MPTFQVIDKIDESLGKGVCAEVCCTHNEHSTRREVKSVIEREANSDSATCMRSEALVLCAVGEHANGCFDIHVNLGIEMMTGGTLLERMTRPEMLTEQFVARVIKVILRGLEYIHSNGIIHRDLKPDCLLLKQPSNADGTDDDLVICIANCGSACQWPPDGLSVRGTPCYMAPEVIGCVRQRSGTYDSKCDLWAMGVIAYMLLSGTIPFLGIDNDETFDQIVANQLSFNGGPWKFVSPAAKDFVARLLTTNPGDRPTATEALNHHWLRTILGGNSRDAGATHDPQPATTGEVAGRAAVEMIALNAHSPFSHSQSISPALPR